MAVKVKHRDLTSVLEITADSEPQRWWTKLHRHTHFIKKAESVHGKGRYDYSLTRYENREDYVVVICPVLNDGPFLVAPRHFLKDGRTGCPYCSGKKKRNISKSMAQEMVINPFKEEWRFYYAIVYKDDKIAHKFGYTKDMNVRFQEAKLGGYKYKVIRDYVYKCSDEAQARLIEQRILKWIKSEGNEQADYIDKRFVGWSECFKKEIDVNKLDKLVFDYCTEDMRLERVA